MVNNLDQTYYARESNLMYRVYAWMCFALTLTACTAYYVSTNPAVKNFIFANRPVFMIVILLQLGLVVVLSMLLDRISMFTAVILFTLYSLFSGVTLSTIFIVFTLPSIVITFFVTAGMFGAMAAYGYFTKADLSSMGSFLFMALIGLIVGGLANLYFKSESFDYILSFIGVIVFTLFTAYDVQKIKYMTEQMLGDSQTMAKVSLIGALMLYLDFVNLFLFLLRFLGRRKE